MTNKKDIFFKKHLDRLPFFLRNHNVKKAPKNQDDFENSRIPANSRIPLYHSEIVEFKMPLKPISKMLVFDE